MDRPMFEPRPRHPDAADDDPDQHEWDDEDMDHEDEEERW